ncbi:ankyrin repeat domain-containing protein 26-like [Sminthopsis crassicaudata]|uniref:ankyrin repeat domain-containing protein 26-like n=1 Tax=Sminthopsis crassicaudata TaxID=9301 RepID=UPI003D686085
MHRKNVKKPEDEKLISKDSSTTSEKVNSSSGILFHSNDDSTLSETDSDELRLTKITLYEKNKDEIEMAADALDNLTQSHNRATDDYDLSLSNYVQGSPCLQEDQNAILSSDLSVKFKYSQLTQLTRKVMSLENTIRELQENFSERIKTEFQLMHQKVECNTCRGRLESEKQNKEKLQAEIDYPSCVSSDTEHQTSKLNLLQETDEWLVLKDQLIYEIGILSIKLSKAENEINQLRDSLREKTLILENTHRELNQTKDNVKELEHKKHMEKEKSNRSFLTKVSMQEGLTQMQRGIQLLPEPFEDVQNTEVFKRVVSNGVQVQFNDRSMTLYAENEKQDCMIEERNKESDDEYVYLRKQIHKYEHEKAETEHVIRKLQEVVHAKKEESMTSQEIMSPYQKVLDVKPLWKELDQNKSKLQESQEENEQLQWCINELEDYVQKIKMENSIFEDSVKEQMCKNEKFQKNILDTTLTQGVEKDNLGKQMEDRLQELKAELSQMKISHEKCKAELETYRRRSQDSGEYAGLYLNSSWHPPDQHQIKPLNWFGETEPTNTWSITNLYQKIFWNNF